MDRLAVSIAEASALLGVSRRTVERLVAAGRLRPVKIGSRTLFTHRELQAFIASCEGRRAA